MTLLSISELMAVALCYLATQVKWPNTQNRTVNSKNAMPTKFIFYTFQFIFFSFKTLIFVSTKQTLPCNLASNFTAFFLKWTVTFCIKGLELVVLSSISITQLIGIISCTGS